MPQPVAITVAITAALALALTELKQGEAVKFNDFLKALPKADERDFEEDEDEEAMLDPNASAI